MTIIALLALLALIYIFVQPRAMAPWEIEEMKEKDKYT